MTRDREDLCPGPPAAIAPPLGPKLHSQGVDLKLRHVSQADKGPRAREVGGS